MFTYKINNVADVVFVKNEEGDVTITFFMSDRVVTFLSTNDDGHQKCTKIVVNPYEFHINVLKGYCGSNAAEFITSLGCKNAEHSAVLNIATLLL